jgi:hypothetical protein
MDGKKVKAIQEGPSPKSIIEVKSFHNLASFYWILVKGFNTLVTPLIEIVKKSI